MTPGLLSLLRQSPARFVRRLLGLFATGLVFILPLVLTVVALAWVLGQLGAVFGPDTFLGGLIAALGQLVTVGTAGRTTGFWLGLVVLMGLITALGALVQTGARGFLERTLDGLLGRLPVVGKVYQPFAQLVRTMGGEAKDEMASMSVVAIRFGDGAEALGLLASLDRFDLGNGPSRLVLIPTAPVPIGGALLFVPEANVRLVPGLQFDDLAKFYVTMGTVAPPELLARAGATPPLLARAERPG
ncbi:MAG: DUF502 domain-containing protein [Sphingomonadaceae bacterium]|uniref:DUF502 domain-containing protein n=1 Tax=Thermaurantiacus sp. TaxID=2820283 RepID=UPI00298ED64A|nr:DUF502 domain-containing protein [Thermaurantiacus sp.]MCS6986068.1 DUF502 domain-containing protein [Sphingomonadaceae bacterium]MDW8414716.1 DUF502 domain-containing protein [Thermaurantiacus sp.]